MRRPALWALAALGCAAARPAAPAEAYAQALEAGDLDKAYALTSPAFQRQVSAEQFRARFAHPDIRQARAATVRDGVAQLALSAPELFGADAAEPAEAVVLRFIAAVKGRRFQEAWHCLSASLRARYTAESLLRDFDAEPSASAHLDAAAVAVEGLPVREGNAVRFPLPAGGAVVVQKESDGWRLASLE